MGWGGEVTETARDGKRQNHASIATRYPTQIQHGLFCSHAGFEFYFEEISNEIVKKKKKKMDDLLVLSQTKIKAELDRTDLHEERTGEDDTGKAETEHRHEGIKLEAKRVN